LVRTGLVRVSQEKALRRLDEDATAFSADGTLKAYFDKTMRLLSKNACVSNAPSKPVSR